MTGLFKVARWNFLIVLLVIFNISPFVLREAQNEQNGEPSSIDGNSGDADCFQPAVKRVRVKSSGLELRFLLTACITARILCKSSITSDDSVLLTKTLSVWHKLLNILKSTSSVLTCQPAFHALLSVNCSYWFCSLFSFTCTHTHILSYSLCSGQEYSTKAI